MSKLYEKFAAWLKREGEEVDLNERGNMGHWIESRIHLMFTNVVDDLFGEGRLSREERLSLSSSIGLALDAFNASVLENAPQLYARSPWEDAPEGEIEEGQKPDPKNTSLAEAGVLDLTEVRAHPLLEKSVRADGTIPVKIIQPGWGSSGYYPVETLERDGPKVFTKGVKMFWNHPTLTEDAERPERDLRDFAAELVGDARWELTHAKGPGLYADAKVFKPYQEAVDELAPHIGVSIRAQGKATQGEAEGRTGQIITEILAAKSVDFVTTPGAGGQILELFEAQHRAARNQYKEFSMTEEQLKELQEAQQKLDEENRSLKAQNDSFRDMLLKREALDLVINQLTETTLPQEARNRLQVSLSKEYPVADGKIDVDAYTETIREAVKAEQEYLEKIAGKGKIIGMNSIPTDPLEDNFKQLKEAFMRAGLDEKAAEIAATGR